MCGEGDDPSMHDRGMCEVRTGWAQDDLGYHATFCESRDTVRYMDIWGAEHWVCHAPGHERRLRSIFPERIQRSLYEDVRKQESLNISGKAIGGSVRPGVPVFDDSNYRSRKE